MVCQGEKDFRLSVTNSEGSPFAVHLVRPCEAYGLRNSLILPRLSETRVEFYDARHPFKLDRKGVVLGQFVSAYRITTLINSGADALNLDGGIPAWFIDGEGWKAVLAFLKEHVTEQDWQLSRESQFTLGLV